MQLRETALNISIVLLLLTLIIVGMIFGRIILVPMAWAFMLSIMILPGVKFLERVIRVRIIADFISVALLAIGIILLFFFLVKETYDLFIELPSITERIAAYIEQLRIFINDNLGIPYDEQAQRITESLLPLAQSGADFVRNALNVTMNMFIVLGLIPIYSFFMILYRRRFIGFLERFYADRDPEEKVRIFMSSLFIIRKYLYGLVIVTVFVAVFSGTGLLILGIEHAVFFAVLIAIFNLIPYVGIFFSTSATILYIIATTDTLLLPAIAVGIISFVQIIENNIIRPFIVGGQIRLNPFVVIISMVLGGLVWGFSGMILLIPMVGMVKVIMAQTEKGKPFAYLLGDD